MNKPSANKICKKCLLEKIYCVCHLFKSHYSAKPTSTPKSPSPKQSTPKPPKTKSQTTAYHADTISTKLAYSNSHRVNLYLSFSSASKSKQISNVVIKTNFKQSGSGANRQAIGQGAVANLKYIAREKANSQEVALDADEHLSNLYNKNADRLTKDEERELIQSINGGGITSFRRIMISPEANTSKDEMAEIVKHTIREFEQKSGKTYPNAVFAIHSNTEHTHAHILIYSNKYNSLRLSKNELKLLRQIAIEKSNQIQREKALERSFIKSLENTLDKFMHKHQVHQKELNNE